MRVQVTAISLMVASAGHAALAATAKTKSHDLTSDGVVLHVEEVGAGNRLYCSTTSAGAVRFGPRWFLSSSARIGSSLSTFPVTVDRPGGPKNATTTRGTQSGSWVP